MDKLRIFLADDHAVLRDGLKALVNAQPDMEVVGEADNGRTACLKARELLPDVVVMDISMPEMNGAQATTLIILPQALRAVIPALFNSFISLFKDTSLVAIIGLFEIVRVARAILAQPEWLGTHREVFLFAFVIYWAFNLAFTYGSRRMEEALGVGKR